MKYRVKYTSVGLLSGKVVGDEVTLKDQADAKHLANLGLIETEEAYQARQQQSAPDPLDPYKKNGGWYEFPPVTAGGEVVKVKGKEAALEELAKREAANAQSSGNSSTPD